MILHPAVSFFLSGDIEKASHLPSVVLSSQCYDRTMSGHSWPPGGLAWDLHVWWKSTGQVT